MLTDNTIRMLQALLPYMDQEMLQKLLEFVRAEQARLRNTNGMPASAVQALSEAVPDKLMRDIVNDQRHGRSEPGWLPPSKPSGVVTKGTGWTKLPEWPDRTKQFEIFDHMVASQVGGPNDTSKLK